MSDLRGTALAVQTLIDLGVKVGPAVTKRLHKVRVLKTQLTVEASQNKSAAEEALTKARRNQGVVDVLKVLDSIKGSGK